jgi:hypothetical protein
MSTGLPKKLDLLDAYHFDFFDSDPGTSAPHPVFHAQRDLRLNDSQPRFKLALSKKRVSAEAILNEANADKIFTSRDFRIPTPQLDIFNLGAVVVADRLVGNQCEKKWENFQRLIKGIHGDSGKDHHVCAPTGHRAGIYDSPRRRLTDWYPDRASPRKGILSALGFSS